MSLAQPDLALMDAFLAGDLPALAILRAQLASSTVSGRELSGVGFFTRFRVAADAPRLRANSWVLQDVGFTHPELVHGGAALLVVKDGLITELEAETYANEPWPQAAEAFQLSYLTREAPEPGGGYLIGRVVTRDETWLAEEYARAEGTARTN